MSMSAHHLPHRTVTRTDHLSPDRAVDHVLVVVFLRGGADGLTLVPPIGDDAYYRARPILAVPKKKALSLDGYFGLHPTMAPLRSWYDAGELAILHGTGSDDESRSHFEAQDTMEHGGRGVGSGWLGRFLRASDAAPAALSAVAIGTTRPESLRGAPAGAVVQTISDFTLGGESDSAFVEELDRLYAHAVGPLGAAARDTIAAVRRLRAVRERGDQPASGAVYPETTFGRGLREIARLIKADVGLSATTIDLGGWDTHFVQLSLINGLMDQLARGVHAFRTDLGAHADRVTTVIMTEFGRRLRENTSFGTDHGAGSVMMVMGAGPRELATGATIRSGWPDLAERNLDAVGDVPASIDYREALRPYLSWHTPEVDLDPVFGGRFAGRS